MAEVKKKEKLYTKLKNKYRLVIMNDETFEEKTSLRLSPLNVFVFFGTVIISLITLVIYITAFTPLREYIPGYADLNMQRNVYALSLKADSLEEELAYKDLYIQNIKNVIDGKTGDIDTISNKTQAAAKYENIKEQKRSIEDSMLRKEIESQDKYELSATENKSSTNSISSFFFFTPLKGTITNTFSTTEKHYGVDIVAPANEAIKSTLDGTVIISNWTSETGYVIGIQHSNNIISLYKHNSALLKKVGAYVKAGEPIAIIGNTGELTTGPHLHFELWYNGTPVNPKDYITF